MTRPAAPTSPPPLQVELGPRLAHGMAQSHEHQLGEPPFRRLRIFTSDPVASRLEGRTAVAEVPFEPLQVVPGVGGECSCLRGRVFDLCMRDADDRDLEPPLLDDPVQLMQDGYAPSEANPRFHAQMVYAVSSRVHASFRHALGREPGWSFGDSQHPDRRLRIYPLGSHDENAWYDPGAGELRFGYYKRQSNAKEPQLPSGWVFTSLSHDIIAHELTHALLDSQRPHFMEPTSADVLGLHEGFADLVALFQHFQYPEALRKSLQESRGVLLAREPGERVSNWLCSIARQFGQSDGLDALRRADRLPEQLRYTPDLEEHDMGEVLLSAVFDAFDTVYRRRTARLRRLASGGTGLLLPGYLPPELVDALAEEAALLAREFLAMVVRALDYCPPADIKLGEFLRAMVTADTELRPDDPWALREALIDAFRVRHIVPRGVFSLSEDSLLWGPPSAVLPPLPALSFAETRFGSAPGRPVEPAYRRQQAQALGRWLAEPGVLAECGLLGPGDARLAVHRATVSPPRIDALETTCRVAAGGDVRFETVAVVTQTATVPRRGKRAGFSFIGGSTLLFSPRGVLKLAINKNVGGVDRIERRQAFITGGSALAQRYWEEVNGTMRLRGQLTRLMHGAGR